MCWSSAWLQVFSRGRWDRNHSMPHALCWRHDMETLSALLAFCEGNPPVTCGLPSQRDSNTELSCFLGCQTEHTVEQTVDLPVNRDVMTPMWRHRIIAHDYIVLCFVLATLSLLCGLMWYVGLSLLVYHWYPGLLHEFFMRLLNDPKDIMSCDTWACRVTGVTALYQC